MNWKAWAPLAVAIVLGLVAAITARNLVNRRPTAVAANAGSQVVFVKQPILPGQEIKADDVTTASLAWKEAPEGTFKNAADVVGRVATSPMVKGEPILEALLAPAGTGAGLQALVPEGMRAITIEVNEFSGIAGLIEPGCSVDVVATMEDSKTKEHLARTIVQDVKVMAVGQRMTTTGAKEVKDPKDAAAVAAAAVAAGTPDQLSKSVTLLTTPTEAETLELASMIGRPRLVLRGQRDVAAGVSNGVTDAQLAALPNESADALLPSQHIEVKPVIVDRIAPATRPSAVEQRIVKVIKGGVESTVTFNVRRSADEPQASPEVFTGTDNGPAIPH